MSYVDRLEAEADRIQRDLEFASGTQARQLSERLASIEAQIYEMEDEEESHPR